MEEAECLNISSSSSAEEEEEECFYLSSPDHHSDDDDDDGCSVDGILDVTAADSSSSRSSCQVITRESLLAAQSADLRRVMELLLVREHHARTLLIRYQWNVDRLFTVFVEKGKAHLFAEAGATVVEHDNPCSSSPSSTLTCNICIEDVPWNEATRMDCGHAFCNNCWTEHFIVKINDGQSRRMRCMAHNCNCICDEGIVRNLVKKRHPGLAEKFDRFLLESFIDDNKMVKWCPSIPHCGNAIRAEDDAFCEVECSCGLQFCFSCLSEAHSPCSCLMWQLWRKKCSDESETVKWITVNTKDCPSCLKPVEKNGGCNAVRCICGKAFCWICGQNYFGHHCTRYIAPPEVEDAKKSINRYMHYYNRYMGHRESIKAEANLEQRIKEKVLIIQEQEVALQDFSWVKNGVCRLFRSRRILSYSYAFAFYMFGDDLFKDEMTNKERLIKQNLFEDQQHQLETKVEKLSGLMEEPFHRYAVDGVKSVREQVIGLTVVVDDLCRTMYHCIQNDLLGPLQLNTHIIASYKSKGVARASELALQHTETNDDRYARLDNVMNGCLTEIGEPASYGDSDESEEPPEKRVKWVDSRSHLNLNLPPAGVEDDWKTLVLS